jgi:hypothetical protein
MKWRLGIIRSLKTEAETIWNSTPRGFTGFTLPRLSKITRATGKLKSLLILNNSRMRVGACTTAWLLINILPPKAGAVFGRSNAMGNDW